MNLKNTIDLMKSKDFKERFKAEYYQLAIRYKSLKVMLEKYKNHELDFLLKCSYDLLNSQLKFMKGYMEILEERAKIEDIELLDWEN